jgi:hypothetical protein
MFPKQRSRLAPASERLVRHSPLAAAEAATPLSPIVDTRIHEFQNCTGQFLPARKLPLNHTGGKSKVNSKNTTKPVSL